MPLYHDQMGRPVTVPTLPGRIISLVPSQTELLFDLGLEERVVGITRFCIHPGSWFRSKTRVGGTKNVRLDVVRQLQPDLIIANKEENVREQVEALAKEFPVWVSDVNNMDEAMQMIESVGTITGASEKAGQILRGIADRFHFLNITGRIIRSAYLIWKDPYMAAGGDTFINDMMRRAGFWNVFSRVPRYPEVTVEAMREAAISVLLLSSEPYPFNQKHIDELRLSLPDTKIVLVDGEIFSWYGSRLLHTPGYIIKLHEMLNEANTSKMPGN